MTPLRNGERSKKMYHLSANDRCLLKRIIDDRDKRLIETPLSEPLSIKCTECTPMYFSKQGGFKVYPAQDYRDFIVERNISETAYTYGRFEIPYGYRITRKRYGIIWYLHVALSRDEIGRYAPLYIARSIGEAGCVSVKNKNGESVKLRAKKAIIIRKSPSALASAIVGEWNKSRNENNIDPVSKACSGVRMFGWHDRNIQHCFIQYYSSKESEDVEETEDIDPPGDVVGSENVEEPKKVLHVPISSVSPPISTQSEDISEIIDIDESKVDEKDLYAPVREWSVDRVKRWVEEDPHTANISGCFFDQYITGRVLLKIRSEEQLKDIGITKLGKRYHMLDRIKSIRKLHDEEEAEKHKSYFPKRKNHVRKNDNYAQCVKRSGLFQGKSKKQKVSSGPYERDYTSVDPQKVKSKHPKSGGSGKPLEKTSHVKSSPARPNFIDRKVEEERHKRGLKAKEIRMRRMRQFHTANIHPDSFVGKKIKAPKDANDRKGEIDRILRIVEKTNDPFEILGISSICNDDEVRLAYKGRIRYVHPDRNPNIEERSNEAFNALTRAKDVILNQRKVLGNPKKYDWNATTENIFKTFMNGKGNGIDFTCGYTDNYPPGDFDEQDLYRDDELLL